MLDLKIVNGKVLDLEKNQLTEKEIGIKDGKIVALGQVHEEAKKTIDAKGKVVSPGFVDIHMHEEDFSLTHQKEFDIAIPMLNMGVTTAAIGNCGNNRQDISQMEDFIRAKGNPVHYLSYIGHNFLRQKVGNEDTKAKSSPAQIRQMRDMVKKAVDEGAVGVSLGIEYCQGIDIDEVLGICEWIKGRKDLLLSAHFRTDGEEGVESVREMCEMGKQSGIPFQLSHMVSCCAFGNMKEGLQMMDDYIKEGVDIMADTYPYAAFSTRIGSDVFEEGCFERWHKSYEDIMLTEAPYENVTCTKEIFEDARKNYPQMLAIAKVMHEEEIEDLIRHPKVMIASDGLYRNHRGHPRGAGTFPKFIGRYLRDEKTIDFFEGMKKITTMPAQRLRLYKKGQIKEGYDADITIFDYDTIIDKATFEEGQKKPVGIDTVIIDGQVALEKGEIVRKDCGKFYRRPK